LRHRGARRGDGLRVGTGGEIQFTFQGEAACTRRMRKRGDNDGRSKVSR
jgi:hypothetical protein